MSRTVVHLLRHGEVFNPEGVLYGRLPGYVLSDLGHEMAGRAATALAGNDITAVISSPMERAQQTAAPMVRIQNRQHPDIALIHHRHRLANACPRRHRHHLIHHHIADLRRHIGHEARRRHTEGLEHEIGSIITIPAASRHGILQTRPALKLRITDRRANRIDVGITVPDD